MNERTLLNNVMCLNVFQGIESPIPKGFRLMATHDEPAHNAHIRTTLPIS